MASSAPSTPRAGPEWSADAIRTAEPVGHLENLHGWSTYITRGSAPTNSTIIFLTDAFGFNLVNNKLLADQYASKTGLRVLVPSLLPGGGAPLVLMDLCRAASTAVPWWNLAGHARRGWAALRLVLILVPFGCKVRRLYPAALGYARAVRASLPLGAKLGVAGFSLGGQWSLRVAGEPAAAGGDSPLADAHFAAHPLSVRPDEFATFAGRFRVPFALALGDRDALLSADLARKVEASLRDVFRDVPDRLQVTMYERCGHGFALRADPGEAGEDEGAERALAQAVAWFRRFLA